MKALTATARAVWDFFDPEDRIVVCGVLLCCAIGWELHADGFSADAAWLSIGVCIIGLVYLLMRKAPVGGCRGAGCQQGDTPERCDCGRGQV